MESGRARWVQPWAALTAGALATVLACVSCPHSNANHSHAELRVLMYGTRSLKQKASRNWLVLMNF
jgi:hypothetical protein